MDLTNQISNLFPEILRENKDYSVLIKLAGDCLNEGFSKIESFTDLVDIDNCPEKFLPLLGNLVGYEYRYDIPAEYSREIIKNVFKVYAMRGTDESIIMAATHFNNPGYIGGDIFLPETFKDLDRARVEYPRDQLFKHSRSGYSSKYKRADATLYQEGIIEVVVSVFDSTIREWVEKVKPAGLRLKFRLEVVPKDNNPYIPYGEGLPLINQEIFLSIGGVINKSYIDALKGHSNCARSTNMTFSGRNVLVGSYEVSFTRYVDGTRRLLVNSPIYTWYNLHDHILDEKVELQLPVYVIKWFRGIPKYSESFIWSNGRGRSGLVHNEFFEYVPYERKPLFINPIYTLDDLRDYTIGESRLDYQDTTKGSEGSTVPNYVSITSPGITPRPEDTIVDDPSTIDGLPKSQIFINYGTLGDNTISNYKSTSLSDTPSGIVRTNLTPEDKKDTTVQLGADIIITKDGKKGDN